MKIMNKYRSIREMLENENPKTLQKMFPHGKPLNRRDLLKAGALQFTATLTVPSLMQSLLMPSTAEAQVACLSQPAFISVNAQGGWAPLGSYTAKASDGDYLGEYNQMGQGDRSAAISNVIQEFGGAEFYIGSQFVAGVRARATAPTLLNSAFIAILVRSTDDSATANNFAVSGLVSKAGVTPGQLLTVMGSQGNQNTATGIGQSSSFSMDPPKPLQVGTLADISNSLTVTGSLQMLSSTEKASLFGLISRLSTSQTRRLASLSGGEVIDQLVSNATGKNLQTGTGVSTGLDPLQSANAAALATAWANPAGQNLQANQNTFERTASAMVFNVLNGNATTAGLNKGGYDYHATGRPNQDTRDFELGSCVGSILESAAIMGRKVFIQLTTDGAVAAPAGSGPGAEFTGDSGQRGAIFCFAYDPAGRPQTVDNLGRVSHQVGHATNTGAAVDQNTIVGSDTSVAAAAGFANYLSFAGKSGLITSLGLTLPNGFVDAVTRIRPI